MLYLFHGTDSAASGKKARTLVESLRAKRPDAACDQISADNWNASVIEGHLGGQGLFSSKYIIFLDRLTENEDAKEALPAFIPALKESSNIFIVHEGKLNAELKKSFEKHAEKIVTSDLPAVGRSFGSSSASGGRKDFNIFALADAVGSRDPVKSWMIFRQAVELGHEAESIAGTLFWQLKSMMLAAPAKSAGEAGLSPFVFSKSKKYAGNYSGTEIRDLAGELITLYHDGHRGIRDLELSLERMLLGLVS